MKSFLPFNILPTLSQKKYEKITLVKKAKKLLKVFLVLVIFLALFWLSLGLFEDPLKKNPVWNWTVSITDRHGHLLKEFLPPAMLRRNPFSNNEQYSPHLLAAVIATEDKRFYYHPGLDPLALIRAAWLDLKNGHIVSGGSTITMQLARLNRGLSPGPRTITRKLKEIWWALLIERHHSKDEILSLYLSLAPCGNLTAGFEAASQVYLGKNTLDISPAEAAFLAGLPASPGALDPFKSPHQALARRAMILKRLFKKGYLGPAEFQRALAEPLSLNHNAHPYLAPHFVNKVKKLLPQNPPEKITTTLDLSLEEKVERLVSDTVDRYRHNGLDQAAVVVMALPSREILAWTGSGDFFAESQGQNDGVLALRQPGSTLKPFIYAKALDEGLITAATLINDEQSEYVVPSGVFSPKNYSGRFHGPLSARVALASSLNIPAIKLTAELGVNKILRHLRSLGLSSLTEKADYYGLGIALGGGEVSLLTLTTAYAALADEGRLYPPVFTLPAPNPKAFGNTVISPEAAYIISDILADDLARATGFGLGGILATPYPSSVKTGTSKNFRDNWCIGYTDRFIVGVWAGNFEAKPMDHISGITGAGYLWRQISDILAEKSLPEPLKKPVNLIKAQVCPDSGLLIGTNCPGKILELFIPGHLPKRCQHQELDKNSLGKTIPVVGLNRNFKLITPQSRETYAQDPGLALEIQMIKAVVQSVPEVDEIVWLLNGQETGRQKTQGINRLSFPLPLIKGEQHLSVIGLSKGQKLFEDLCLYTVK